MDAGESDSAQHSMGIDVCLCYCSLNTREKESALVRPLKRGIVAA